MNKAFSKFIWVNYPETDSPLNASNLNSINDAIDEIDDRVVNLDTQKADQQTVLNMVRDWTIDTTTGVITLTYENGSKQTFDAKLNKLVMNFSYDRVNQRIVLDMRDGTHEYIDISDMITENEFKSSSTVSFVVSNGTVTATVPDGSITESKLEINFLANARLAQAQSEAARDTSEEFAKESEAWAIGTKDGTPVLPAEEQHENNSKYYAERASAAVDFIRSSLQMADFSLDDDGNLIYTDNSAYLFNVNDNGDLEWEVAQI